MSGPASGSRLGSRLQPQNRKSLHAIKHGTRKKWNVSSSPGQTQRWICTFFQWTTLHAMNKWITYFEDGNLRARAQAGNPINGGFFPHGALSEILASHNTLQSSAAAKKPFDVLINRDAIHSATFLLGHPALPVYSGSLFSFNRHPRWLVFTVRDQR